MTPSPEVFTNPEKMAEFLEFFNLSPEEREARVEKVRAEAEAARVAQEAAARAAAKAAWEASPEGRRARRSDNIRTVATLLAFAVYFAIVGFLTIDAFKYVNTAWGAAGAIFLSLFGAFVLFIKGLGPTISLIGQAERRGPPPGYRRRGYRR